jgi:outer membrane PBP1 activator LpoA protein
MEPLLSDPANIHQAHTLIWDHLLELTPIALTQLATEPPPDIMSGWLELARIAKTLLGNAAEFDAALSDWRQRYPQHPATQFILDQVLKQHQELKRPEKLALLLPLSGKLAQPAAAIRDGFLAAYYARPEYHARTVIRFYDTEQPNQTIEAIYRQAVDDGAEFIVGPLDKQKVSRLALSQELSVPVLSLNQSDGLHAAQENLYQFGLIPEDEARQVAERTSLAGLTRAVVIAPKGEWGDRVAKAFSQRFEEIGGTVLEEARYQFGSSDFSSPITRLLNLDESEQRYQRLRNALPSVIRFEPRRRQDIDFIFMAAFPRQARQIAPQLRFHHAADVPVYSTSHAYNGTERVQENQDMNGVIVCDSAWILNPDPQQHPLQKTIEQTWPDRTQGYARLFALGIDAYRLLPRMRWLQNNPGERYQGATGNLTLDADRIIHRTLKWGQFEGGKIKLLNDIQAEPAPRQPAMEYNLPQ